MEIAEEDLSRFFADLAPELNERRRRIVCGATARLLGRGGITVVSRAAGISRNTVAAGVAEIRAADHGPGQRVRRRGAGRKSATEREPRLLGALEAMLATERQHPDGPLDWTLLSTYEIADTLRQHGYAISPSSVAQLMHGLGYFASGRARPASQHKRAELHSQYQHLSAVAASFAADDQPVICLRATRSELASSTDAGSHDDDSPDDDGAGRWVRVGPDLSVVGFAVEAIQRWWAEVSPLRFPDAARLLVCTETFGLGADVQDAWKYHLARLAHATGLAITIQRIPAGAWRWREREAQYSYSVTLQPGTGKATRCRVMIDLITWSGVAAAQLTAGPVASGALRGARQGGGCDWQHTARPSQAAPPASAGTATAATDSADGSSGRPLSGRAGGTAPNGTAPSQVPRHLAAHHGGHRAGSGGLPDASEPRRPKIAEVVAHNIARDISTRRLRPGARLPSETVALTRFNVSRSSLREALRLLELLGVISIKTGAGGGPVVSQVTSADFGTTTTFYFHLIGVTIRELLEARCILEPALVRLAVEVANPVAKGKLRAYMNNWGGDEAIRPAWLAPGDRSRTTGFHRALIETGNAVLDLISHSLQNVWTARQYMEPFPWQAAPHHDNDHWVIAQAILGNDSTTAESLMRTHMDYLYDFANAHWSGLMDEVIDWH